MLNFPEIVKSGVNRGIIRSLNLNAVSIWFHVVGFLISMFLQYYFIVVIKMDVRSIWIAKISGDVFVVLM